MSQNKTPAPNGRFGASGGVARPTVCADFEAFAPVRALVETPACVKPLLRYRQFGRTAHWTTWLTEC